MTVFTPPPLPVKVLPLQPARAEQARLPADPSVRRLGLVLMFLLCSVLTILGATLYVWHRDMTAGGGSLMAGGFFYMLGCLFMYLIAVLTGIMSCWHVLGGFVVACGYAWRGRVSRTGFWVMGAGYGLLAGALLLDAANAGIGPAVQPLAFPIPRTVAVWVVPAVGVVIAFVTAWAERNAGEHAA